MADVSLQTEKLGIGRVFSQAFGVLGRNFVTFALLALCIEGLPSALISLLQLDTLRDALSGSPQFSTTAALGGLAGLILSLILQGALVYGFVTDLGGRKATILECLTTGLRNFLPLFGVAILFVLGVAGASLLLIVPGIMLACAWCVAAPALVIDRTDVPGAFGRSLQLTRGSRWRIFGLGGLFFIVSAVVQQVLNVATLALLRTDAGLYVFALVWGPLLAVANALVGAAVISALYVELRRVKEGADPAGLAAVFD